MPKYRNKKTQVDGIVFASKKEADRYLVLKSEEKRNKIQNLELQKTYRLSVNGRLVCKYNADFDYDTMSDGELVHVTEDVKSPITKKNPTYRIKAKLFRACQGYDIMEI